MIRRTDTPPRRTIGQCQHAKAKWLWTLGSNESACASASERKQCHWPWQPPRLLQGNESSSRSRFCLFCFFSSYTIVEPYGSVVSGVPYRVGSCRVGLRLTIPAWQTQSENIRRDFFATTRSIAIFVSKARKCSTHHKVPSTSRVLVRP